MNDKFVQIVNVNNKKNSKSQEELNILRKVANNPEITQRIMAKELGVSLGKLNYCLKALKSKGFIKIQNFNKQQNKLKYFQYMLTPKGITERTNLTLNFMKRKFKEYDELKKEIENK